MLSRIQNVLCIVALIAIVIGAFLQKHSYMKWIFSDLKYIYWAFPLLIVAFIAIGGISVTRKYKKGLWKSVVMICLLAATWFFVVK